MTLNHKVDIDAATTVEFGRFPGELDSKEADIYRRSVSRLEELENSKLALEQAGKLTEKGIKEKLLSQLAELAEGNDRDIADIERDLAEAHDRANRIAVSGVEPLEPTDAVGALRDRELRDFWRQLDGDQRADLHLQMIQGRHPDLALALLRGPAVVTNLLDTRRIALQDVLIRPDKRQQLGYVRNLIVRLEAAKKAARASNLAMQVRSGALPSEVRKARGKPSMVDEVLIRHGRDPLKAKELQK